METVNNATAAVKNAIWGEGANTENGSGTTTENGSGTTTGTHSGGGLTETHKSMIDDTVTESRAYSGKTESDPMAEGSYDPDKKRIETNPQGPTSTGGQPQGANVTGQQNTNDKSMSNSNEPNTGFGGAGAQPSVTAEPTSGQQDTPKHQGADRPNEEPSSTGSGESGPGQSGGPSGGSSGGPGGMKLPDEGKSKGEGTGTKYEKSTGLHADGGDFDATRPGAAKEADRLMDEMGVHHGVDAKDATSGGEKEKKWYGVDHSGFGGHGSHSNKSSSVSAQGGTKNTDVDDTTTTSAAHDVDDDGTGKKGLGQKIKEKLHHS